MRNTLSLLPALMLVATGCTSAEYNLGRTAGDDSDYEESDTAWGGGSFAPEDPAGDDADFGEPEQEGSFFKLRPAQTDVFVFVANPERDTVTRINVLTREVDTTDVGSRPGGVVITQDYSTAIVLNKGDDSITIIDAGTLEQDVVAVRDNMNSLRLSPDGAWVALWHDPNAVEEDDPVSQGATSYNEVSLVEVATGVHTPVVVGFNPKDIQFTPTSREAVVVADATMAVLDLTTPDLDLELVEVSDPLAPPSAEEVVLAPDGSYAFVRQFGSDALTVVDLVSKDVYEIPVGLNPTDLDLTPDGEKAVVVSRGAAEISLFDLADPFASPEILAIPNATPFGSVEIDATGTTGVLYTTAGGLGRYGTWDLASSAIDLKPLPKPIQSVAVTPEGGSLLIVHSPDDNADGTTPDFYQGLNALSMIDLNDFRANTLTLTAEPAGFANASNGAYGYVILEDRSVVEVLDYSSLIFEEIELRSPAVHIGVLPDLDEADGDEPPAWISQEHPLGRISFFDADDSSLSTITGFELNSQIED